MDMITRCQVAFGGRLPRAFRGRGFTPATDPAVCTTGKLRAPSETLVIRRITRLLGKLHILATQLNVCPERRQYTWTNACDIAVRLLPAAVRVAFQGHSRVGIPSGAELVELSAVCRTVLTEIFATQTQKRTAERQSLTLSQAVRFCKATEAFPRLVSTRVNDRITFHPEEVAHAAAYAWQEV